MGYDVDALRVRVQNALERMPDTVDVSRPVTDDLDEPAGAVFIARITGQYYKARNSFITTRLNDGGQTALARTERFMTVIGDDSRLLTTGDFFMLNGVKYVITDIADCHGIYFDLTLERA